MPLSSEDFALALHAARHRLGGVDAIITSGTAAALAAANLVHPAGQLVYENDTNKLKIADGTTAYNTLPYLSAAAAGGLQAALNLSDVANPATARGNLGAAPTASPVFTGNPVAPTQAPGDNSTKLSTTAFVAAAIAALVNSSPAALDTLKELADAIGDDANFAATMATALAGKMPTSWTLSPGSGLSGGGDGTANRSMAIANGGVTFAMLAAAVQGMLASNIESWAGGHVYAAGDVVQLPTGGRGIRTAPGTSNATFDAAERDAWTFIPGGHYEKVAAGVTSWKCPVGITSVRFKLWASGAGGGGGGTGHATTQVGGAGGGAGAVNTYQAAVTAGTSYTTSLQNGGAGGAGGAAGSNNGANGANGADATITIGATTYTSKGGGGGARGLATSAATATAGVYGVPGGVIGTNYLPGAGSVATSAGSVNAAPIADGPIGGGGGSNATATLGGTGGNARTAPGAAVTGATTQTGTTSGGAGTAATEPGCGGGGGGGGAPSTGVAGNGGAGGPAQLELYF